MQGQSQQRSSLSVNQPIKWPLLEVAYSNFLFSQQHVLRAICYWTKNVKQMNVNVLLGFISKQIQKISVIRNTHVEVSQILMLFGEILMAASLQY